MKDKKPKLYSAKNERAKYSYRQHLRRVSQKDEKTVMAALKHIREFEVYTDLAGFETFNADVADKYIQSLFQQQLSLSFIENNIRSLREFLYWLERQHGFRSKINYNHIAYLNISRNQKNTAKAVEYQKSYKFDEIIQTIRNMPSSSDREKRDKAIISLQALCTLRINELRTVKIKNLIQEDEKYFIYVTPKNMQVKFAKTRHVNFLTLPQDIIDNVIEWRERLLSLGFKESDPLFPRIDDRFAENNLLEQSVHYDCIKSETTIRQIFKKAFEATGYDYIKPHNFRKTLVRFAETQSPAFLNAIRQNLGHVSIDTTLSSYGQLSEADQRQNISSIKITDES